jgi:hypothetical protein
MYSGKIAVPPGGGGIVKIKRNNDNFIVFDFWFNVFKFESQVHQHKTYVLPTSQKSQILPQMVMFHKGRRSVLRFF